MPQAPCSVPLDEAALRALLPELDRLAQSSVAVAFLHSYASAVHERRVREILAEARPGLAVTLSSEVCPEVREYERTSTAVRQRLCPAADGRISRPPAARR